MDKVEVVVVAGRDHGRRARRRAASTSIMQHMRVRIIALIHAAAPAIALAVILSQSTFASLDRAHSSFVMIHEERGASAESATTSMMV